MVIVREDAREKLREALTQLDIQVYTGDDSLAQVATFSNVDIVLTAVVGFAAETNFGGHQGEENYCLGKQGNSRRCRRISYTFGA